MSQYKFIAFETLNKIELFKVNDSFKSQDIAKINKGLLWYEVNEDELKGFIEYKEKEGFKIENNACLNS